MARYGTNRRLTGGSIHGLLNSRRLRANGFRAVIPIIDRVIALEEARASGPQLLRNAAKRVMELLLLGKEI